MPIPKYIEIIPWVHGVKDRPLEEVTRYIYTLPRGSVLAVERSMKNLGEDEELLTLYSRMKPKAMARAKKDLVEEGHVILPVRILAACRARDIQVIPLETTTGSLHPKADYSKGSFISALQKADASSAFREAGHARVLERLAFGVRVPKVVALSGVRHCKPIQRLLEARGIGAHINTRIFSQRKIIEKYMELDDRLRKVVREGHEGRAVALVNRCFKLLQRLLMKVSYKKTVGRMANEVFAYAQKVRDQRQRRLVRKRRRG